MSCVTLRLVQHRVTEAASKREQQRRTQAAAQLPELGGGLRLVAPGDLQLRGEDGHGRADEAAVHEALPTPQGAFVGQTLSVAQRGKALDCPRNALFQNPDDGLQDRAQGRMAAPECGRRQGNRRSVTEDDADDGETLEDAACAQIGNSLAVANRVKPRTSPRVAGWTAPLSLFQELRQRPLAGFERLDIAGEV